MTDPRYTVAADLGGSNADLLLADERGRVVRSAVIPALAPEPTERFLHNLLALLGVEPADVCLLAVTGGRHQHLGASLAGVPLRRVDEIAAIARGGLLASGLTRALIVSMGTGTAFVSADGPHTAHAAGVALGGGTVRGLAHRLLGTTEVGEIAALAAGGTPSGANLTIADIVGGGVGMLPGDVPASYLARLAGPEATPSDVAAGILDMIGHIAAHMALLTARIHDHDAVVFIGHMLEYPTIVRAARRLERAFGGGFVVPPEPGRVVARGALDLVRDETTIGAGDPSPGPSPR
jgi:type II pantothenate kinase